MSATSSYATRDQVVALHALYGQWEKHSIEFAADPRAARLAWASEAIGREIRSFADLTRDEGRELIDHLKESMGQPVVAERPDPWRHIRARDRAHAAGTAGRKDEEKGFIQLANADDFARIDQSVKRLGWTNEQFASWLASNSSPLKGKNQIRTVGEANKVWWALKKMLKRTGRWAPAPIRGLSGASRAVKHSE